MRRKIRILLTGGGTGGHIFPLVAVAEALRKVQGANIKLFYLGPTSPLNEELEKNDVKIYKLASSKLRRYFDLQNILDIPKFFWSLFQAIIKMYFLMPDVVFSKGGPGAFPVVLAARFYFIPVIIHESDAVPGLTNRISSKLAKRIAISFSSTQKYFSQKKTFLAGNPVREVFFREDLLNASEAKNHVSFSDKEPLLLVLGGSQGSETINSFVLDNLGGLLQVSQIYHQVGLNNFEKFKDSLEPIFKNLEESARRRYRAVPFLDLEALKGALNAADIVISRAGSGAIFEIASFGKPSILVPLRTAANDHQKANAYEYADSGASIVIEENNFTINLLLVQIKNILEDKEKYRAISEAAKKFFRPDAAETIGQEIVKIALRK